MLSCRDLTFRYQKEDVFRQLSFAIQPGEAVLLMGPSGCGKSSLAYCLAGLYPAYAGTLSGEILLEGKPLEDYPLAQRAGVCPSCSRTRTISSAWTGWITKSCLRWKTSTIRAICVPAPGSCWHWWVWRMWSII